MKILALDTSSDVCGVSILEDKKLLCISDANTGRTHSENLMPMINETLQKTGLKAPDIELVVCDIGPGSFTGIRIGVATAKAFSDSLNIPNVGVSSLETLAYNATLNNEITYVCSILDCKNDNCYFALYEKRNDELLELIEPNAVSVEEFLSILKSYCEDNLPTLQCNFEGTSNSSQITKVDSKSSISQKTNADNKQNTSQITNIGSESNCYQITFVGDGSKIYRNEIEKEFNNANFIDEKFDKINSYALGLAGLEKYNILETLPEVLPLYLRKPQAQRQMEEKQAQNI